MKWKGEYDESSCNDFFDCLVGLWFVGDETISKDGGEQDE